MSEPRPRRSAKLLTALIGLILAISAGYALRSMQAAQRQLDSARTDLQRAQEMASEIVRLRDQRRIASLAVEASSQIAERVSSSLQAAGVAPASLIRVEPQSAVRIGRTPYLLRDEHRVARGIVGAGDSLRTPVDRRLTRDDSSRSDTPRSAGRRGRSRDVVGQSHLDPDDFFPDHSLIGDPSPSLLSLTLSIRFQRHEFHTRGSGGGFVASPNLHPKELPVPRTGASRRRESTATPHVPPRGAPLPAWAIS